jgi:acyl-CoA synthetase (AMP-forming)/AMP-acid ligase II
VERDASSLAVVSPDRHLTVGQLVDAARHRAGQLRAHGVDVGARVIVARPNSVDFVIDYLAVRLCGAVLVNLPWSARNGITAVAEAVDANCVVLAEDLVGDDPIFDTLGVRRFRTGQAEAVPPNGPVVRTYSDVAWLACTSGTTGAPKAAIHTEESLERQTEVFVDHFGLTADDPILVISPVGHAVGLLFGVRMGLRLGSLIAMVPRWSAEAAADLTESFGCTFTVAPTPFLMDVVDHAERNGSDQWRSLRFFPSAGAPVPRSLVRRALEALPGTQVWSYFGTSEAGAVTAVPMDASLEQRLESDGTALPGMATRVVDGELQLSSPNLMSGYWGGDPNHRMLDDGWYATGDVAEQRDDGYIVMFGRAQDIILRGGENISPLEVEDVLHAHPSVADVAVVGIPDERLGSRLAAVVVGNGQVDLDVLREHCSVAGMPRSKWPEHLVVVDSIPMSAIGKVNRDALGELVAEGLAAKVES